MLWFLVEFPLQSLLCLKGNLPEAIDFYYQKEGVLAPDLLQMATPPKKKKQQETIPWMVDYAIRHEKPPPANASMVT